MRSNRGKRKRGGWGQVDGVVEVGGLESGVTKQGERTRDGGVGWEVWSVSVMGLSDVC